MNLDINFKKFQHENFPRPIFFSVTFAFNLLEFEKSSVGEGHFVDH